MCITGHNSFCSKWELSLLMKCKMLPQEGTFWKPQCQVNSPALSCLSLITRQCPPLTLDRKDGTWKILRSPWHTAELGPVRLCALSILCYPNFRGLSTQGTLSRQFNCPICLQFASFCSWACAGNSAASISTLMIHCLKDLQGSPAAPPDKVLTSGFSWLAGLLPTRELRGIIHQNTT